MRKPSLNSRKITAFNIRKITRASSDCSPSGSLENPSNKSLLREEVFSENLERDIENFITDRIACQANTNVPNPTPKGPRETYHAIFSARYLILPTYIQGLRL